MFRLRICSWLLIFAGQVWFVPELVSMWEQFYHKLQHTGCVYNHTETKTDPLSQPSPTLG